ncbi:hypothetical protein PGB90_009547 [Kerria lacca]
MSQKSTYDNILQLASSASEYESTKSAPEIPYDENFWKTVTVGSIERKDKKWVDTAVSMLIYCIVRSEAPSQTLSVATALASQIKSPNNTNKLLIPIEDCQNLQL